MPKLREYLQSNQVALFQRAEALIQRSNSIAVHAPSSFPTATSHGREHLATVETIADLVLTDEFLQALTDYEVFFLLLAIYFHDLGMVGEESEFSSSTGREKIRKQHAVVVGEKIIANWETLGFQNENEARILADICRGHRPRRDAEGNATWSDYDEVKAIGPSAAVRVRVVAALIYAIDELHLGDDRAEKRLQNWINIENEISRQHWQRHNEIRGPVLTSEGCLLYDAIVKTNACEDDLRRNVFSKAFGAIAELNRQLATSGIQIAIPKPVIQWDRSHLVKLTTYGSDGLDVGCSISKLEEEVFLSIKANLESNFSLENVCSEIGNDDEYLIGKIKSEIGQLQSMDLLVETSESTFSLNSNKSSVERIGKLLREADELDALFMGKFHGHHEFNLHCKNFGDRYVEKQVLPVLKTHFGFEARGHKIDDQIVRLLKASPSAARFAIELKPIPTELVKRRLLATVVIAGFSRDCLQNNALILNKPVRDAFRSVSELFTKDFERTIEFYEELGLIGGLDETRVSELLNNSEDWTKEFGEPNNENEQESTIKMSQKFERDQPKSTTSFFYYLLAGMRSGNHVELRCNYDSSIVFDTANLKLADDDRKDPPRVAPCSFVVGPGQAQQLPKVDMRCDTQFDSKAKTLSLIAAKLSDAKCRHFPLIITFPTPKPGTLSGEMNFSFLTTKLTVGHALHLRQYSKENDKGNYPEIRIRYAETGKGMATLMPSESSKFTAISEFSNELIEKLALYDPTLPMPWYILEDHEQLILDSKTSEMVDAIAKIKSDLQSGNKCKAETTLLIRETETGEPYRETFLGFKDVNLSPPSGALFGDYDEATIKEMWDKRQGEFKLVTRLREDTAQVATDFAKWGQEERDWPIRVDHEIPHFHQTKTIFTLLRKPLVDRFWYFEAPNEITLRSATKLEKLETELGYWNSIGDAQREELVKEKIERIKSQASVDAPVVTHSTPPAPKTKNSKADKKRKRKLMQKQKRHSKRK